MMEEDSIVDEESEKKIFWEPYEKNKILTSLYPAVKLHKAEENNKLYFFKKNFGE